MSHSTGCLGKYIPLGFGCPDATCKGFRGPQRSVPVVHSISLAEEFALRAKYPNEYVSSPIKLEKKIYEAIQVRTHEGLFYTWKRVA